MLFSGAERIGDVLAFGTLKNIVSLGHSSAEQDSKPAATNSEPAMV